MDGLRKVPDNVPNKDMLTSLLGKPLTRMIARAFDAYDQTKAKHSAAI